MCRDARSASSRTAPQDRVARARDRQVMRIQGTVVLPVGAAIELTDPNLTATVTGIRLLAGDALTAAHVCLDVEVPGEYWGEEPMIARMR